MKDFRKKVTPFNKLYDFSFVECFQCIYEIRELIDKD